MGGRRFSFSLSLLCIFPFSSLLLPFSPLFSRSSPSSPSLLPSVLFPLSWSIFSSFSFSAALPCIYRKTGEGERVGAATVGRPLHHLQWITTPDKWVNCGRLIAPKPGTKVGEKRRKKMILLPCSLRIQGKKTMVPFQNGTVLCFFFIIYFLNFIIFIIFYAGTQK